MSAVVEQIVTPYFEDAQSGIIIYNADCRDVILQLPAVDLVLTDPPFDKATHEGARTGAADRLLVDFAAITSSELIEYLRMTRLVCERWQIAFIDWRHMLPLEQQERIDLNLVRFGVWTKPNGMPQYSGDRPATGWEAIAFLHPKGKKQWNGGGRPAVFDYNFEQKDRSHPTQKPLGLIKELMKLFSNEGDMVLDPFMGSGTTLRAAKDLGRKAIGIEIEERYCEIAANRLRQEVLAFRGTSMITLTSYSQRRARLYIVPQRYPTHTGERPLSFAVYKGRTFLCYSWSLTGAWIALQVIRKSL